MAIFNDSIQFDTESSSGRKVGLKQKTLSWLREIVILRVFGWVFADEIFEKYMIR